MLNILKQFQSHKFKKLQKSAVIGVLIFIILSMLFMLGLFSSWQEKLSDTLYTEQKSPDNIAVIAIDDKSIQEIGRFPWDRSVYAKFLTLLSQNKINPKVIGIDISFLEKSNDKADAALANSIKNLKNTKVVLASEYNNGNLIEPIGLFKAVSQIGFVNTVSSPDGITRKFNPVINKSLYSFSYKIAQNYSDKSLFTYPNMRINYVGKKGSFHTYSFSDVLNGQIDPKIFEGKIILIGATAADLHDDEATPTSAKMPGVEIQANIIETLIKNNAKENEIAILTLLTIFIFSVFGSIIFVFLPPIAVVISSVVFGIFYILYVISSFDAGVIRNIIYPLLALIFAAIANIIYKYVTESAAKKFIRKTFSYYLSESVLNHLLNNPHKIKLGGERKELTVLFSDIAGFTSISEKLQAHELAELLNNYLTKMTDIVFKYDGVLDKYIGDAIMAFWGAPNEVKNHALNACITALEMQKKISENFDFTARVGINSGEMVVGNMGSNQRFDYSLLGDNVNLGSRLEGINKMYGTKICISQSTYDLVKDDVTVRKLDIVAVKGKNTGVPIYELIHMRKETKKEKEFLVGFEMARALYEKGKFKNALLEFKKFNKKYPKDPTSPIYIDRIKELIETPPSQWDGVYHATSK
jgi:CHASE2 domain-containing sensor protein/class 3 adenylate cyclase